MKDFNKETIGGLCIIALLIIVVIIIVANKFSNEMPKKDKTGGIKIELEPIISNEEDDIDIDVEQPSINNEVVDISAVVPELNVEHNRQGEKYVKSTLWQVKDTDEQMAELYSYWNDYKLDAVSDLINLERVRALTDSLEDTDGYYYYGDVNNKNIPNGKGLAIYAHNTYYFGDWKDGDREGNGMWLRVFPDEPGTVGSFTGVLEHQYSGEWKNDLPYGNGQEHYTYEPSLISDDLSVNNAIGQFKNGYYDGEMLLMIMEQDGNTHDWIGVANNGEFKPYENISNDQGRLPALKIGPNSKDDQQEYYYMTTDERKGWGISTLMK